MKPEYGTVLRWRDTTTAQYIVMALGIGKLGDGFDALVLLDSEKLSRHGPGGRTLLDEGNVFSMAGDEHSWEGPLE